MELEILSRLPKTAAKKHPLLFVHGAFCCGAIWDEHFLPYFAEKGYAAHAISLRGHGKSPDHALLPFYGLADYVTDLARAVAGMDRPPVLVGHSMGGVVVQRYLRDHTLPGAVLMGAGPPHGMMTAGTLMMLKNPLLYAQIGLMQLLGPKAISMGATRKALFATDVSEERMKRVLRHTQAESLRVGIELIWPYRPRNQGTPLLVLGAEKDYFISPTLVKATARAYHAPVEIFPGMGHAMMVERDWPMVAERMEKWLEEEM